MVLLESFLEMSDVINGLDRVLLKYINIIKNLQTYINMFMYFSRLVKFLNTSHRKPGVGVPGPPGAPIRGWGWGRGILLAKNCEFMAQTDDLLILVNLLGPILAPYPHGILL